MLQLGDKEVTEIKKLAAKRSLRRGLTAIAVFEPPISSIQTGPKSHLDALTPSQVSFRAP